MNYEVNNLVLHEMNDGSYTGALVAVRAQETLSTLRYADRMKQLKTTPVVNEVDYGPGYASELLALREGLSASALPVVATVGRFTSPRVARGDTDSALASAIQASSGAGGLVPALATAPDDESLTTLQQQQQLQDKALDDKVCW